MPDASGHVISTLTASAAATSTIALRPRAVSGGPVVCRFPRLWFELSSSLLVISSGLFVALFWFLCSSLLVSL